MFWVKVLTTDDEVMPALQKIMFHLLVLFISLVFPTVNENEGIKFYLKKL